ncbi:hypothetical protein GCM10010174_79360 [Kutzneria viridogrisea]|uniref:Uncharacterized protein n=1 Tax=Kutzneria viridogrisea TaxID=47990 RepID=A0ABR6BBV7_9PSEU|nr:hypothetical protein [Kutzneria viridogrisea]
MSGYSKGYQLRELRAFDGWTTGPLDSSLDEDDIAYLRDDLAVVRDPVIAEAAVIFSSTTAQWRDFCAFTLGFPAVEGRTDGD